VVASVIKRSANALAQTRLSQQSKANIDKNGGFFDSISQDIELAIVSQEVSRPPANVT
jgi:hypothetical protein